MDIYRIPKQPGGATLARLVISKGRDGRVMTAFSIEGPMSSSSETGDYASQEEAGAAAEAAARRRQASCLLIEDRT